VHQLVNKNFDKHFNSLHSSRKYSFCWILKMISTCYRTMQFYTHY